MTGDTMSASVSTENAEFEDQKVAHVVEALLRDLRSPDCHGISKPFASPLLALEDESILYQVLNGLIGNVQPWQLPPIRRRLFDFANHNVLVSKSFEDAFRAIGQSCQPTVMEEYARWVKLTCAERKVWLAVAGETVDHIIKHNRQDATPELVLAMLSNVQAIVGDVSVDRVFTPAVTEYFRHQYGFHDIGGNMADINLPVVIQYDAVSDIPLFLKELSHYYRTSHNDTTDLMAALRSIVTEEFAAIASDKETNARYPTCRTLSFLNDFIDQTLPGDERSQHAVKQHLAEYVDDLPKVLHAGHRVRQFEEHYPNFPIAAITLSPAPTIEAERYRMLGKRAHADSVDMQLDAGDLTARILAACDDAADVVAYMHHLVPMICDRLPPNQTLASHIDIAAVLEKACAKKAGETGPTRVGKSGVFYNVLQSTRIGSIRRPSGSIPAAAHNQGDDIRTEDGTYRTFRDGDTSCSDFDDSPGMSSTKRGTLRFGSQVGSVQPRPRGTVLPFGILPRGASHVSLPVSSISDWGLYRIGARFPACSELDTLWRSFKTTSRWTKSAVPLDLATELTLGFLTKATPHVEVRALVTLSAVSAKNAMLAQQVLFKLWEENDDPTLTVPLSLATRYVSVRIRNETYGSAGATTQMGDGQGCTGLKLEESEQGKERSFCADEVVRLLTKSQDAKARSELEAQVVSAIDTLQKVQTTTPAQAANPATIAPTAHATVFLQWCFELRVALSRQHIASSARKTACDLMLLILDAIASEVSHMPLLRSSALALLTAEPEEVNVNWDYPQQVSDDLVMKAWDISRQFDVSEAVKYCLQGAFLQVWFGWLFRFHPSAKSSWSSTYKVVNDAFRSAISACGRRRPEAEQMKIAHRHTILDLARVSAPTDLEKLAQEISSTLNFQGRMESDQERLLAIHALTFPENRIECTAQCLVQLVYETPLTALHMNRLFVDSYLRRLCSHILAVDPAASCPGTEIQSLEGKEAYTSRRIAEHVDRFVPLSASSVEQFARDTAQVFDVATQYDRLRDQFLHHILRLLAAYVQIQSASENIPLGKNRYAVHILHAVVREMSTLVQKSQPHRQLLRGNVCAMRQKLHATVRRDIPCTASVLKQMATPGKQDPVTKPWTGEQTDTEWMKTFVDAFRK